MIGFLPSLHVWGTAVCVWPGLQSVYHPAGTWGFLPASGDRWGGCPALRRDRPVRHKTETALTLWFHKFCWDFVVSSLSLICCASTAGKQSVHMVSFRLVCDIRSGVCTGCFILKIGQMLFVFPDFIPSSICSVQLITASDWALILKLCSACKPK